MKAFDDSNAFVYRRYVDPFWKLKRFLKIGSEAILKKNVQIIDDFVHGLIKTKRKLLAIQQDSSDKEDILSKFLLESKKDLENMTDQYMRDIILNFMIAGKDTSANTLSWFFYMLCKHPLIQENIAQEVKDVTCTQESKLSIDEFVAYITDATVERMHYLHAALTETLRLYPAVPVNGRTADAPDILPDIYKLNKGDGGYYLAYAMGRMPYIWGKDAEEFRHERWLKDGVFQPESSFKFIAFHAGPRICLGKDFLVCDLFCQGIFAIDGDKWKQQRKLASYEFSTRVLRDFSCSVFRTNAAKLVRLLSEFSHAGLVFDMQDVLMRCTLDSIFKVGFGVELNCLEGSNKEGSEFMKAFDDSNALVHRRLIDPFWKLKRFLNIGSEATLKKNVKVIDDFVHAVIRTKREHLTIQQDANDKEDILSRFLIESKKNPKNMTDQYLKDIILNFMIAGKDTSANTLSWFFYMLCKYPLIQEKIFQEVKDVTSSQESKPKIEEFVANITDVTLDKMHYLHAVLTETLRLYPAVPIDGREAESNDTLPDGYRVKKGDVINYMAYAMGRMPYIWGDDAEEFQPERWLNNGVFQPESSFKFVAFHAGPRICLGKEFAYRQMKIVSMTLLRFFRFKLANEKRNITYRPMFTLHMDKGLPLCAVPR